MLIFLIVLNITVNNISMAANAIQLLCMIRIPMTILEKPKTAIDKLTLGLMIE